MGHPFLDPIEGRRLGWQVFGFRLPEDLFETPPDLVEAQAAIRFEMDTTTPIDPFEFPIELIWNRLPSRHRESPLADEIERALARIFYGRAFFYVQWAPLRAFHLKMSPEGQAEIEGPSVSRTQELAYTGAAIINASTVIERCLDLAAQIARTYRGEPLRVRPDHSPIEPARDSRNVIAGLVGDPEAAERVTRISPAPDLAWNAVESAAQQLSRDPFPLIDLGQGVVPTTMHAELLRHMFAHARDQDFALLSKSIFGQFADAMGFFYNLMMWVVLANSLGGACSEWPPEFGMVTP